MRNISPIIALAFGTFILSVIGLYNGYPLVYSDTGTYIASGLKEFVPYDRPITYGLFIKLFSFNISLWYVVFFQNLITAYVIYELLKSFSLSKKYFNLIYLAILAFLVLFTGTGWYSNQIMPDFFAPLAILIIYILLSNEKYSMVKSSILYLILIFSLVTHFSHLLMGLVIIVMIILIKLVAKKQLVSISFRKIVSISSVIIASWVLIPLINYVVEGAFVFSKGNHVFLVAHLNDTGILKEFLDEKCDETEYQDCKLCNYKDSLPDDLASFIWSGHILDSTGGWTGSKEEYNKIIFGTLKEPEFLFLNIFKSVQYGLIQLTRNDIGQGLSRYGEGSPPYGQIHWEFHHELNDYMNSRQNRSNDSNLNFDNLNTFHNGILILSSLLLLVIIFTPLLKNSNPATTWFLIFIIICVIINAFITAGLNSPCTRFQARVIWLVPLAIIIFVVKNNEIFKMKKLTYFLLILLSVYSCNDKTNNEVNEKIIFSGITETDEFGVVKSIDSTDWQLLDEWNDKEKALFDEAFEFSCNNAAFDYSVITYPNPCQDLVTIRISKPLDARFSFRIVDENYYVLVSRDTMNTNSIFINLETFILPGDTVRIYYKFTKIDCELKGHGDVAIEL